MNMGCFTSSPLRIYHHCIILEPVCGWMMILIMMTIHSVKMLYRPTFTKYILFDRIVNHCFGYSRSFSSVQSREKQFSWRRLLRQGMSTRFSENPRLCVANVESGNGPEALPMRADIFSSVVLRYSLCCRMNSDHDNMTPKHIHLCVKATWPN